MARLLAVEDNRVLLRAYRSLLAEHFELALAATIDEGLAALAGARFDVVLCDLNLEDPEGRDGAWLLERVRVEQPAARRILITGETGASLPPQVASGLVDLLLFKPVDPVELLAHLGVPRHSS